MPCGELIICVGYGQVFRLRGSSLLTKTGCRRGICRRSVLVSRRVRSPWLSGFIVWPMQRPRNLSFQRFCGYRVCDCARPDLSKKVKASVGMSMTPPTSCEAPAPNSVRIDRRNRVPRKPARSWMRVALSLTLVSSRFDSSARSDFAAVTTSTHKAVARLAILC